MSKSLIVQLARFGDLVQTKRLVLSLAALGQEVHLCLDASLEALAQLLYPQAVLHPITAHWGHGDPFKVLVKNHAVFEQLASEHFDAVYNLNFSPLNFRLAALFDSGTVHGYKSKNGQDIVDPWPAMAMRWSRDRRIGLNLVDFWAGYATKMCPPQTVNPCATPKGDGIGIVMAGRESRRSLPVSILVNVAMTAWKAAGGGKLHLLGSASESPAARAFCKQLPAQLQEQTFDLTGKTDWKSLVEVVSSLNMVLTPDTGVMHLAAHLGTPVTAFFLSSAWCFETGPYGSGHTVYQAVEHCLPCLENKPCPHDVLCLKGFANPAFLRFMSTRKASHAIPGLLGLESTFDELGVTYSSIGGEDIDLHRRCGFRKFVAEHCGLSMPAKGTETGHEYAERLYLERDWLLAPLQKRTPDTQDNPLI